MACPGRIRRDGRCSQSQAAPTAATIRPSRTKKKLADVDQKVLRELATRSWKSMSQKYGS